MSHINFAGDSFVLTTVETDASTSFLEIKTHVIQTCKSLKTFFDSLDSPTMIHELEDQTTVLFVKLQINDSLENLDLDEIKYLNSLCFNKSIVIFITSENCFKSLIYWKSKDIPKLITLKHHGDEFTENDRKVYEFVADFLASSLSKGQLGIGLNL